MFIHNSCTCNGNLNLIMKTGNAYKKKMLPQTIVHPVERCKSGELKILVLLLATFSSLYVYLYDLKLWAGGMMLGSGTNTARQRAN